MIRFTVAGTAYGWDNDQQMLSVNGRQQAVVCQMGDGGLCDIQALSVAGKSQPIPALLKSARPGTSLRKRMKKIQLPHNGSFTSRTRKQWAAIVFKTCWSCTDLVFLVACVDTLARSSKTQDHRELFGQLVGMYLLLITQSALLYDMLEDTFHFEKDSGTSPSRFNNHVQRGGADEIDDLTDQLRELSLNSDSDSAYGPPSSSTPAPPPRPVDRLATVVVSMTRGLSLQPWLTLLGSMLTNVSANVFRVSYHYPETLAYMVAIGMVLYNQRALRAFTFGREHYFQDLSRGTSDDQFLPLQDLNMSTLRRFQPTNDADAAVSGAYLCALNLYPPVPLLGHFFAFSEQAYWLPSSEISGPIQSFFAAVLGNPATGIRERDNYLAAHAGMSLLFVAMLCQTVARRPFGIRLVGNVTSISATILFVLLLIYRCIFNIDRIVLGVLDNTVS